MLLFTAFIIFFTSFSNAVAVETAQFNPQGPLRGYLTDGSSIQWKDTEKSTGPDGYEFLFDDEGPDGKGVPVGQIKLDQTKRPTLEAEWIIYFPEGMPSPKQIESSTRVCLTGMAETKYMTLFIEAVKQGEILWGPMSLKNDVIAKGDCILTTIGDIAGGLVKAEVVIKETTESGEILEWRNHARSLVNENLVSYLKELSQHSRMQHNHIDFVNLGATDKRSAVVNNTSRRIMGIIKSLPFVSFVKILQIMFSDAIRDRHYTRSAELRVVLDGKEIAAAHITATPSAPKTNDSAGSR